MWNIRTRRCVPQHPKADRAAVPRRPSESLDSATPPIVGSDQRSYAKRKKSHRRTDRRLFRRVKDISFFLFKVNSTVGRFAGGIFFDFPFFFFGHRTKIIRVGRIIRIGRQIFLNFFGFPFFFFGRRGNNYRGLSERRGTLFRGSGCVKTSIWRPGREDVWKRIRKRENPACCM